MISDIRQRLIESKVVKYIIVAMVFAMGFLGIGTLLQQDPSKVWVALVNRKPIGYDDFVRDTKVHDEEIQFIKSQYGQYAEMLLQMRGMANPAVTALNDLISESLLEQEAHKLGLHIDEESLQDLLRDNQFVNQHLRTIIPFYLLNSQSGGVNLNQVAAHLRSVGLSMQDFETKVENAALRNALMELVMGASYVPTFEKKEQYLTLYGRKKFSIIPFSFADQLTKEKNVTVTPEEVKQFYDNQNSVQRRYWVPEKRDGTLWRFDANAYGISVTDEEIDEYYQENKVKKFLDQPTRVTVRTIVFVKEDGVTDSELKDKAEAVRQELVENPESFAQKAKELSGDQESAKNGGLLETFTRGTHDRDFEKAAFLLKKDGDISKVIQTPKGYEVIQRVSKEKMTFKPLSTVYKEIRNILINRKFGTEFLDDMTKIMEDRKIDDAEVKALVKDKKASAITYQESAKDSSQFSQELFRLKPGQYAFYVEGNAGHLVKLDTIKPEHLPSLESISETVTKDLYQDRAEKALEVSVERARDAARKESFGDVATQFGSTVEKTEWIRSDDQAALASLRTKGYPVDQLLKMEKPGTVDLFENNQSRYLVRVDEMQAIDSEKFAEKEDEITQELNQSNKMSLFGGFIASLYRNATIEINESLSQVSFRQ